MTVQFIAVDALEAAFAELLEAVSVAIRRAVKFKSILKSLAITLSSIQLFYEIEKLSQVLDRPASEKDAFTDRLEEAAELVRRCFKVKWWHYCKRYFYAKKLKELETSLLGFFQMEQRHILVIPNYLLRLNPPRGGRSVSFRPCGAPQVPDFVIGLDVPLQRLKTQLLKREASVVLLSAPAGCGKTTLAKMLCHDHEIEERFERNILFVTVSNKPNVNVIVKNLFQHLVGLMPEFQNDSDAIIQLENLLKQIARAPMLLVLDDVWSGSESLVEKFQFQIPGYKILVTSRDVFSRFDFNYNLELLNDQDAMALFCRSAFPQCRSVTIPDDLVSEIVRGCKGFPLALKVVGRSLRGQPEVMWRRTLKQWSQGQSIFNFNSDLHICLKTSLDALDESGDIKKCFLDLCSFPEDQRIAASALVDMWVELYNFDEEGIDALANIHELSNRNLINLFLTRKDERELDGYYNEHFVIQHGLLRDLAIHHCSQEPVEQRKRLIIDLRRNGLAKWSIGQIQPFSARLLSIYTDETFSSSWYNMQLPKTEVLVLNIRIRSYNLPEFMEKMDQLKVLIIVNYGFFPAELTNFPLLGCLSNLKRIRLEHVSVSSLGKSTLQLSNLQKISLIMCEIGNAFRNCIMDIPCIFPNLMEIDVDRCNDLLELPEGLCDIVDLKKLSITNCHELDALPEGLGKLTNLEMLRLSNCTKLIRLPESTGSLHQLKFLDISDCLNMNELPILVGGLCGLQKLSMRGCGLCSLPPSVNDLWQLKHVICDEGTADLWEPFKVHLTNLEINVLKEDINLT